MDRFIKDVFLELAPLLPEQWEKAVFHGFFSGGTYDFAVYVRKQGETHYCSILDMVSNNLLSRQLVRDKYAAINSALSDENNILSVESRWNGITMVFDNDFHFSVQYEYENENRSHTAEWGRKYLSI